MQRKAVVSFHRLATCGATITAEQRAMSKRIRQVFNTKSSVNRNLQAALNETIPSANVASATKDFSTAIRQLEMFHYAIYPDSDNFTWSNLIGENVDREHF